MFGSFPFSSEISLKEIKLDRFNTSDVSFLNYFLSIHVNFYCWILFLVSSNKVSESLDFFGNRDVDDSACRQFYDSDSYKMTS